MRELRKMVGSEILLTIAGNKLDLERQRVVSRQEAADYATSVGAAYSETSAKLNKGIDDVFGTLGKRLLQQRSAKRPAAGGGPGRPSGRTPMVLIDDEPAPAPRSGGCC